MFRSFHLSGQTKGFHPQTQKLEGCSHFPINCGFSMISLVLMCQRATCDITAGTACDPMQTYEKMQQEISQVFTAGMPAKLNSSLFRRHGSG